MTDLITRALRNATDTRAVVIGEGAVERTGEVFTELFGAARAVVVADERTFAQNISNRMSFEIALDKNGMVRHIFIFSDASRSLSKNGKVTTR